MLMDGALCAMIRVCELEYAESLIVDFFISREYGFHFVGGKIRVCELEYAESLIVDFFISREYGFHFVGGK
ncbi:hypothetical protein TIFTF001_039532 [Ficus carica]|uniref:Uncharacterized protein n=1 Tax=Ficus carica TaxID=3494 RepID=A0AA88JDZ2_FICCA|nr:hypothetical protein TIFTF001_039532 [Ficus carica]